MCNVTVIKSDCIKVIVLKVIVLKVIVLKVIVLKVIVLKVIVLKVIVLYGVSLLDYPTQCPQLENRFTFYTFPRHIFNYRLYTEEEFEKLPQSVPPEICRSDLSSVLLQLKALGIHNLLRFTFPTPPPAKSLLSALEQLYALKAIDKTGNLTQEGNKMAELPLKPMYGKMLCESGEYGCVDEILSIVSMLQMDSIFIKQYTGKACAAARMSRRNNFEVAEGDIIMYLNIFDSYNKVKNSYNDEKMSKKACKDWCQRMYINYRVMEKTCEIRSSLEKLVKGKFNIENKIFEGPDLGSGKCIRIMKCILTGIFPQAACLTSTGEYKSIFGAKLYLSENSCLYRVQQPTWVVFASVQSVGDKINMRDLMVIQKEWLLEIAPHYYTEV